MATYVPSVRDVKKNWIEIDAEGAVLGRLAAYIASILKGKNKPHYTSFLDCGDNVVVVNAEKLHLTGKKMKNKVYYRHTGYLGGLKSTTPEKIIAGKNPERLLKLAVKRMLGNTPMGRHRLSNLKVYAGSKHKHEAQKPMVVDFKSLNVKNARRVVSG
ncbi:50S ribosomal protein L13 [Anaplasmataceae bacterium AB001_6]|nr:50S ribosomal protein L13 [Anaplasmataceae bacterium AB001_6]